MITRKLTDAPRSVGEERKEWRYLVPDQALFTSGGQTEGRILTLAARHKDGRWAMVYCADKASFTINMRKLAAKEVEAFWIDPRSAESAAIGRLANTGVESFSTPRGP